MIKNARVIEVVNCVSAARRNERRNASNSSRTVTKQGKQWQNAENKIYNRFYNVQKQVLGFKVRYIYAARRQRNINNTTPPCLRCKDNDNHTPADQ
jgi:hypothetical protein